MAALDLAAQLQRQRLLAVADGEDRHVRVEHRLRRARAALLGHRGRTAREDHALGLHAARRPRRRGLERVDFAIDAGLAQAARDQLGHLRAEIDDEDGVGGAAAMALSWRGNKGPRGIPQATALQISLAALGFPPVRDRQAQGCTRQGRWNEVRREPPGAQMTATRLLEPTSSAPPRASWWSPTTPQRISPQVVSPQDMATVAGFTSAFGVGASSCFRASCSPVHSGLPSMPGSRCRRRTCAIRRAAHARPLAGADRDLHSRFTLLGFQLDGLLLLRYLSGMSFVSGFHYDVVSVEFNGPLWSIGAERPPTPRCPSACSSCSACS